MAKFEVKTKTCLLCGKTFTAGNDRDDVPNGLCFRMEGKGSVHVDGDPFFWVCGDCVANRYEDAEREALDYIRGTIN